MDSASLLQSVCSGSPRPCSDLLEEAFAPATEYSGLGTLNLRSLNLDLPA